MFQISGIRDDIREIRADLKLAHGKVYEVMGEKALKSRTWSPNASAGCARI